MFYFDIGSKSWQTHSSEYDLWGVPEWSLGFCRNVTFLLTDSNGAFFHSYCFSKVSYCIVYWRRRAYFSPFHLWYILRDKTGVRNFLSTNVGVVQDQKPVNICLFLSSRLTNYLRIVSRVKHLTSGGKVNDVRSACNPSLKAENK